MKFEVTLFGQTLVVNQQELGEIACTFTGIDYRIIDFGEG